MKNFAFILFVITFFFVIVMIGDSMDKPKSATEALLDAGYHPIDVGGRAWFKCSEGDVFSTKFRAYSPDSSRIVTGCVCEGFFKGKTIRLD